MAEYIEPRLLKGFRDFLPEAERERLRIVDRLRQTFESFGFEPIDTPVLEYTEILLGKGGGETDKQVYRFTDQGGRDVSMRFDLTVPFARFMAMHVHELPVPFKRYHISKVFRGENTQRGRYREFTQCDFDIVGSDGASADFETVMLMDRSFRTLGIDGVRIHLSHRGVFNALVDSLGLSDKSEAVLRVVDKIHKIGREKVRESLEELAGEGAAATLLEFISKRDTNEETLSAMREMVPRAETALDRLDAVFSAAAHVGIADKLVLDPSITRGLDYYTGIVFETFLVDLPEIGSVCSGGRYDNLAGLYSKAELPGVGASIGLDRLVAALEELGASATTTGAADAVIICEDPNRMGSYHAVAGLLRDKGLKVDVMTDPRKPVQQFKTAEKKAIPAAVIVEPDYELGTTGLTVRILKDRENTAGLGIDEAADLIRRAAES